MTVGYQALGWHALWWAGADQRARRVREASGTTAHEWWEWVQGLLGAGGITQVWIARASLALAALDTWRMVEVRDLRLAGHDERAPRRPKGTRGRESTARIILADPPVIVDLRIGRLPGTLRILDVSNHGWPQHAHDAMGGGGAWAIRRDLIAAIDALAERGMGQLADTASGQAWRAWRIRDDTGSLWCHRHTQALALECDAVVGGRCETSQVGHIAGPIHYMDYAHLYPWCATLGRLPSLLTGYHTDLTWMQLRSLCRRGPVLARVHVRTDRPDYPLRRGEHTIYPVGSYWTTLADEELVHAVESGRVDNCSAATTYTATDPLTGVSESLIALAAESRRTGAAAMAAWAKLMSVALIGRLCRREVHWEDRPHHVAPSPWGQWIHQRSDGELITYRSFGWRVQAQVHHGLHVDALPAVAAAIYARARCRLREALEACPPGTAYYWDTDSVWCSEEGYQALMRSGLCRDGEPGYLRSKGEYPWMEVAGIKHYTYPEGVICAGRPMAIAPGRGDKLRYLWQMSATEQAARGTRPAPVAQVREWTARLPYQHGHVDACGRVTPYTIEE